VVKYAPCLEEPAGRSLEPAPPGLLKKGVIDESNP
jgi:hypothetical protein